MQNWPYITQNVIFDMRFSRIFEQLFPRKRRSSCYRAQNMESMTQAASKGFFWKHVFSKIKTLQKTCIELHILVCNFPKIKFIRSYF